MAHSNFSIGVETSNRKVIVAVDFGTTFSGIAYAQTCRPEASTNIIQWPAPESVEGVTSDKVPTTLAYDHGNVKWGFQLDEFEECFQQFKLGLNPTVATDSLVSKKYSDPNGLRPDARHSTIRLTTDYLTKLREHALNILKLKLADVLVDTTPIEWVVTVPAIWTEDAKAKTIACAKAAGMHGKISLVSEPEAAILYALDTMDPNTLVKGDIFVMCDAGGGTVDLISYLIKNTKPLVIEEVTVGSGSKRGSAYLNRIFVKYLQDNLSHLEGWEGDTLEEALGRFERVTKRTFTGNEESVLIPVPGLANNKSKSITRNKLTMSGVTIRSIFDQVVNTVTTLVQGQIAATSGTVSAVLMVGGFGQSPYLREAIKAVVGPDIKVLQPAKGWTAVVNGGLLKALNEEMPDIARLQIASRRARKCYGTTANVPFVQGKHQQRRKFYDSCDGYHRIGIVNWPIKKGDELFEHEPLILEYRHKWLQSAQNPDPFYIDILSFESETGRKPPMYEDQAGVRKLASLHVPLSGLSRARIASERGCDGELYQSINVEIKVKFESAHIDYSLWYNGRCYGSVEAKYD